METQQPVQEIQRTVSGNISRVSGKLEEVQEESQQKRDIFVERTQKLGKRMENIELSLGELICQVTRETDEREQKRRSWEKETKE